MTPPTSPLRLFGGAEQSDAEEVRVGEAGGMRDLGPHILDLRSEFSDVVVNPRDWLALSTHVVKRGRGPGSLEPEETAGLDYHVITASTIARDMPNLFAAYGRTVSKVRHALGRHVVVGTDDSAINVNIVQGDGGRYEWHTDSQRWTVLLFATPQAFYGGELVVKHPMFGEQVFPPVIGQGVLFDGAHLPHAVRPMRATEGWGEPLRITIPMVFVDPSVPEQRAEGTDGYLYR